MARLHRHFLLESSGHDRVDHALFDGKRPEVVVGSGQRHGWEMLARWGIVVGRIRWPLVMARFWRNRRWAIGIRWSLELLAAGVGVGGLSLLLG